MNIISIKIPLQSVAKYIVTNTNFFSNVTFLDAELIFWDVFSSYDIFPENIEKVHATSQERLNNWKQTIQRRKREFDEFFNIGRTLIITSPKFLRYKYKIPGSTEITYIDYIDCLNIDKPQYESISGKNIKTIPEDFIDTFYELNKKNFIYNLKIVNPKGYPLMYIKDTKYVVAEFFRVKNGLIIIFPKIQPVPKNKVQSLPFFNTVIDFVKKLSAFSTPGSNEIPVWVNKYVLPEEREEIVELSELNEKLEKTEAEINERKKNLLNYRFLKALFASDGGTLETVVGLVLREIGFEIEKPANNRDDLIIRTGKKIAIVEVKGLKKSAAEKNAAQLQKWVSSYHAEKGDNPKGILIVNTFKNVRIENRKEADFPNQMIPYAKRMNHCLITGLQLLCIYLDFKSKKLKKKEIVDMFFNTDGELKYKENPMELIEFK